MANDFKVMLAAIDSPQSNPNFFKKLRYPLLGSAKLDGIRSVVKDRELVSRKGIRIPSMQCQSLFNHLEHCDGELMEGCITDINVYNRTQGHVQSANKPGDMSYHLFDYTHPDWVSRPYHERLDFLASYFGSNPASKVCVVEHEYLASYEELLAYEEDCLGQGFEGIMLNDPVAPYKNGRSTFNQGWLLKLKRFEDCEGALIAFEPTYHNTNEKVRDELGYAKRSQAKEGLVPIGMVGKFIVESEWGPIEVAPGMFTHDERTYIWENQNKFLMKSLKYRFFKHGMKDKPRFPRAIGWRDKNDF